MPRKPRQASSTGYYHFINRGVNKMILFHEEKDYRYYYGLLLHHSTKLRVRVHHYCLMRNHTHLLVSTDEVGALSCFAHFVQRRYAYYYCRTHNWSEQVFRKRFLSAPIEDEMYLMECGRYIERNPLEAKITKDLSAFAWSSFRFYAQGAADALVTPSPHYEGMGYNEEERRRAYRFYVLQPRIPNPN